MALLGTGPRGGNLSNPQQHPEVRTAHLNSPILPDGGLGLHRFEKQHDTATMGFRNEQPWHRMAAYMLNAGRTNSEIAVAAGVTVGHVSILRGNKWFQELCATIANTEGEEILGAIRSHVLPSIERIADIAQNSENERLRFTASLALLEHGHGKPIQKIVSDVHTTHHSSPEEEYRALQEELRSLRTSSQSREIPLEAEIVPA